MKIGFVAICFLAVSNEAVKIRDTGAACQKTKVPHDLAQGSADAEGKSEFLGALFGGWGCGGCGYGGCGGCGAYGYPGCGNKFEEDYQRGL